MNAIWCAHRSTATEESTVDSGRSLYSTRTRLPERTVRQLICITNTFLGSTQSHTFLSHYIRSCETKQSNKMYRYLAGANIIKPFMLSVQCVLNLCPEVSPRGLAQMEEQKTVLKGGSQTCFVCQYRVTGGVEVFQICIKKEVWKEWESIIHPKLLGPDTRICLDQYMFVWSV